MVIIMGSILRGGLAKVLVIIDKSARMIQYLFSGFS